MVGHRRQPDPGPRRLDNWTDDGLIVPPAEDDPTSPLHPARLVDRPHIVRDERPVPLAHHRLLPNRSQISSAFEHPAERDSYVAPADRWPPNVPAEVARRAPDVFRRLFADEGDVPVLDWHDEGRIEDHS